MNPLSSTRSGEKSWTSGCLRWRMKRIESYHALGSQMHWFRNRQLLHFGIHERQIGGCQNKEHRSSDLSEGHHSIARIQKTTQMITCMNKAYEESRLLNTAKVSFFIISPRWNSDFANQKRARKCDSAASWGRLKQLWSWPSSWATDVYRVEGTQELMEKQQAIYLKGTPQ